MGVVDMNKLCPRGTGRLCPLTCTACRRPGSTRQWRSTRTRILQRDQGVCGICGKPGADSVDHVLAVRNGGGDHDSNLRAAHLACNRQKGAS